MTPGELIRLIEADGARLTLTPNGRLRITGDPAQIERHFPTIGQYEQELVDALRVGGERANAAPDLDPSLLPMQG